MRSETCGFATVPIFIVLLDYLGHKAQCLLTRCEGEQSGWAGYETTAIPGPSAQSGWPFFVCAGGEGEGVQEEERKLLKRKEDTGKK